MGLGLKQVVRTMTDGLVNSLSGKRIVLVSTVPYFMVSQLSSQIQFLRSLGMQVTIITSPGDELNELSSGDGLSVITMDIPRKPEPWRDFKALLKLFQIFRKSSFDILHSTTPKAGLLCAVAGKLAGIPVRLHTFTGQAWVTRKGLMRRVMRFADKVIILLMTHCYADSPSQRDFLIEENMAAADEISVIGHGSLGGVDMQRFSADRWSEAEKHGLRNNLGLMNTAFVATYIGRITRDKGVNELLEAFEVFQRLHPEAHLLMLGPVDEEGVDLFEQAAAQTHVHCLGYQPDPERFLSITNVLCLPSYREGFGTVVIEAAAMGVPCIGTKIAGLVDAVEDGDSGILIPIRDVNTLRQALQTLAEDQGLCVRMGEKARGRTRQLFSSEAVSRALATAYLGWCDDK